MTEYTMPEERDFIDSWACAHVRHELNSEQTKKEAREFLARVRRDAKAEAILMDGFDMAVADRLADAGYTEYAEDEDGGVTWVSAPLGEVLHIVRICATEYETGDRA